jgi:YVTN family beta-propeller protein
MRSNRHSFFLLAALSMLVSCRKDKPESPNEGPIVVGSQGGVYITNEGNFGFGNAKVSYYDIANGTVVADLYQPANGVSLGDVCQSMRLFNNKGYVVVNNSNKVVVVDPSTFVVTATITGFNSPRYLLPVSNSKAYVTDLYANSIAVVNLSSSTITGSIPCPGWTEELVLAYGKAFVTNQSRNHVYVIDTATDLLMDSIPVSRGGNSIVEDANGKLWVACSGGSGTSPALHRIDPQSLTVEATFPFPSPSDSPWRLDINSGNDTLYYLNSDVYRMAITAGALPSSPFINASGRNFYGIGIEPNSGVVYVADAIDYVQQGTVYRYKPDGTLLNSFPAGIIPGDFCFN